jgi:uncharacterized membrane protein
LFRIYVLIFALAARVVRFYSFKMRRVVTLILYLALVVAGLYLNLWLYQTQTGARFSVLVVGCFLVLFGGYMLWTNFLSPNRSSRH